MTAHSHTMEPLKMGHPSPVLSHDVGQDTHAHKYMVIYSQTKPFTPLGISFLKPLQWIVHSLTHTNKGLGFLA